MEPITVAGHVMLTDLHNDLYMVGPYKTGTGTAVQLYLKNGYGISLTTSEYGDAFPFVGPIRGSEDGAEDWNTPYGRGKFDTVGSEKVYAWTLVQGQDRECGHSIGKWEIVQG